MFISSMSVRANRQEGEAQDKGRQDRRQQARQVKDDTPRRGRTAGQGLHAACLLQGLEVQGAARHLDHAHRQAQAVLLHRHLAHGRGSPGLLQDKVPDRVLLP